MYNYVTFFIHHFWSKKFSDSPGSDWLPIWEIQYWESLWGNAISILRPTQSSHVIFLEGSHSKFRVHLKTLLSRETLSESETLITQAGDNAIDVSFSRFSPFIQIANHTMQKYPLYATRSRARARTYAYESEQSSERRRGL